MAPKGDGRVVAACTVYSEALELATAAFSDRTLDTFHQFIHSTAHGNVHSACMMGDHNRV
jgi:hypothetical protein